MITHARKRDARIIFIIHKINSPSCQEISDFPAGSPEVCLYDLGAGTSAVQIWDGRGKVLLRHEHRIEP